MEETVFGPFLFYAVEKPSFLVYTGRKKRRMEP